jgi:flagellar hook-basal body complex protein FliE
MGDLRIDHLLQNPVQGLEKFQEKGSAEFGKIIKEAINRVDRSEKEADGSVIDLLQGKASIHQTMLALQKADISMRLMLSIRNKVIEAYREIMHMQF